MLAYLIGGGLLVAVVLFVKSLLQRRSEESVSSVLDQDVKKAKSNSDKKVQEYKDAKDNFSANYSKYLESKRKRGNDST